MKTITGRKVLLKRLMIALGIILIIEVIFFLIYKLVIKKSNKVDEVVMQYNNVIVDNDGYIAVGSNNYKDLDDAKYIDKRLITQGEITKLDKDFNTVWTTSYYMNDDISLNDIIKIKNGYIIIGTERKKLDDSDDYTGIILKVDNNGTIIYATQYDLLENTKLNKIIKDDKNIIIIGSSQYEYDRIGNDLGGGIILKIDENLNILEHNNYGGNKSGSFNNIFVVSDGYLVSGVDANQSIIVKFSKSFNRDNNDNELISKKVTYYKTFDKDITFSPLLYSDNKLYDGNIIFDIKKGEITNKDFDKKVFLIDNKTIYAIDNNIVYLYDLDLNLINEIKFDNEIINILKLNDIVLIKKVCDNNKCVSKLDMLTRH